MQDEILHVGDQVLIIDNTLETLLPSGYGNGTNKDGDPGEYELDFSL